jgi:hypothetical protein
MREAFSCVTPFRDASMGGGVFDVLSGKSRSTLSFRKEKERPFSHRRGGAKREEKRVHEKHERHEQCFFKENDY